MKKEFILAFNELLEDRQLPREIVMEALEAAMVSAYRKAVNASNAQHIVANVDPLGRVNDRPRELEPEYYGFTDADLDCSFSTHGFRGSNVQTLRAIIERLDETYCGSVGVQFMHIDDLEARDWLQRRWEDSEHRLKLTRDQQLRILEKLTDAVIFEEFVRTKYVGAKTFSLEGSETLIPLLDFAIERLAQQGVREIAMGMSHRGRLNVLANIIGKKYHNIFREFEDVDAALFTNRGDVKYHLGHAGVLAAGETAARTPASG